MFKQMRRKDREILDEDIEDILINGEYGTLSTISNNGYPYIVPLNYIYYDDSIYFHCARDGHKLENIKQSNKVCFCVVMDTHILSSKFSTKYKSCIAFGTASEVTEDLKEIILIKLIEKYSQDFLDKGKKYIESTKDNISIIKIDIQHKTGKANI